MNNKILFFISVLFSLVLVSCKKNYTCTCYDHFGEVNSTETIESSNKEEAENQCYNDINYGTTASCQLTPK